MHTLQKLLLFLLIFLSSIYGVPRSFQVGAIRFVGALPLSSKELKRALGLNTHQPVTAIEIEKHQKQLLRFLTHKGFLWARIDSMRLVPLADSTRFNLEFAIHLGPLFKLDSLFIQSDSLPAQSYRRRMHLQKNEVFDQDVLKQDIRAITDWAAENGFPFVEIETQPKIDNAQHTVRLTIRIREGRRIFIKGIILQGNRYTKPNVALRALYYKAHMPFRQSWFRKIIPRLRKLQIYTTVQSPQMIRTAPDSVLIVIPVTEGNATTFDGVIGYVPEPGKTRFNNQKGYFTGLLNFSFENLFGTGRKLKIFWEKSDRLSENFNFEYAEPWIFNQPVNMGLRFMREVKDSLYVAYDFNIQSDVQLNENFALFLNVNRHSVTPDSTARKTLGLVKNRIYNIGTGLRFDTRDFPLNPITGVFYQSSYRFGLKTNTDDGKRLKKNININTLSVTFEFYRHIFKNQVLALKFNGRRIRGVHLQISDYFWLGGSRSVRGYREKQFSGYLVSWANLEYRFITGRNTRIFLFTDFGYYENKITGHKPHDFLQGSGLGLRFETPLGIMGLDFGFAKGEAFNQGKIHFGLSSRF